MNSFGQYTQYNSGNNLTTTKTFDCLGMLRTIGTGNIQNLSYSFNEETGNMISRRDNRRNLTELFSYDNLGRLTEVSGPSPIIMNYANNGNILNKTTVGDYSYGTKPHAVTGVTNPSGLISTAEQRVTYTSFNKADSIIQNNYKYALIYGQHDQRTRSKLMNGAGTLLKTTYYVGAYEKEVISGNPYPKEIHYIYGGDGLAAIYTKQYVSQTMHYVHKDHLGSLDKITNSSGNVVDSLSFDAWGRRRNPANWTYSNIPATLFSRGYTGHEHLDQFDLINMNGRMYDPLLGRFLSPDRHIQNPFNCQNFNRYTYVLNNPLLYIDPSGYSYLQNMKENYCYDGGSFDYRGGRYSYDNESGWSYRGRGGAGGAIGGVSSPYYDPKSPTKYRNPDGKPIPWTEVYFMNILPFANEALPDNKSTFCGGKVGNRKFVELGWNDRQYYVRFWADGKSEVMMDTRTSDGKVYSLSFDFAFIGGFGFEFGLVTDNYGGRMVFFSGDANIGYGIGFGPNTKIIHSKPGTTFHTSDFLFYSAGYSAGIGVFGQSYGGNKAQYNFTNFNDFGQDYYVEGGGASLINGPDFGAWWSNTRTYKWFDF
jgi:RHS repeat-associated protein